MCQLGTTLISTYKRALAARPLITSYNDVYSPRIALRQISTPFWLERTHPSHLHTPLPVHLAFWRGFDMDAIRVDLDKNSEAISESQIESATSRKRLGESTKAFKRVPDDAKLAAFGGLLKVVRLGAPCVCVCFVRFVLSHTLRLIVSNVHTAPH